MTAEPIRFDDGAAYERYMGRWSRVVGASFLDWLAPAPGLRWLDVGCGNGAFTELLVARCAPASVDGIDPSEAQLAYAREGPVSGVARFHQGDAMALPFAVDQFDAAVMPLVIFFLSDPPAGVAEMARVVGAGGIVSAYAWDMRGGGFPYHALQSELREMGASLPMPPSPDAARLEVLQELWDGAGLRDVETRAIVVPRTFADFEDYWTTILGGPSVARTIAELTPADGARLRARMQERLPTDAADRITLEARAHAVQGRVPH